MKEDISGTSFSIRPYDEEDLEQILAIEKRNHLAPWSKSSFEAELGKPFSQFWVLTDDETDREIAAYVIFWDLDGSVEVLNIAVKMSYQRRGFAQQMMRKVISYAIKNERESVTLDVRKSNTAAVTLYQKLGFVVQQTRKGFYSNGEDAYFMKLDLTLEVDNGLH